MKKRWHTYVQDHKISRTTGADGGIRRRGVQNEIDEEAEWEMAL